MGAHKPGGAGRGTYSRLLFSSIVRQVVEALRSPVTLAAGGPNSLGRRGHAGSSVPGESGSASASEAPPRPTHCSSITLRQRARGHHRRPATFPRDQLVPALRPRGPASPPPGCAHRRATHTRGATTPAHRTQRLHTNTKGHTPHTTPTTAVTLAAAAAATLHNAPWPSEASNPQLPVQAARLSGGGGDAAPR